MRVILCIRDVVFSVFTEPFYIDSSIGISECLIRGHIISVLQ